MDKRSFRLVILGLALLLVAVVALAFVFNPKGIEAELPRALLSVFPAPDASVQPGSRVEVNLGANYSLALRIDGVLIPADEVRFSPPGRYSWEPREGGTFDVLFSGLHTAEISWDRTTGLPDVGGFTWSFRVQ